MTSANAAIYFDPRGYSTGAPRLMGRHAAGEGFLRAFMRHADVDMLHCCCAHKADAEEFARLRDAHAARHIPVRWVPADDPAALADPGALYVPGPNLAAHAWRRRRVGSACFSLCGVTHTIASHGAMDEIAAFCGAPLEPWDGLVCTSRAVLEAVRLLLEAQAQWLAERLGARRPPLPELALIPLGADCDALAPDPAARAAWRARLGIGADEVAFLFFGRLSFHGKANPGPMYAALEEAARRAGRRVHLVQAGWFHNESIRREFEAAARALCPSVKVVTLDGREREVRAKIWHAADVFTSLADNVQETFGLAPLEAMAAGLPCVVSDWNGYRDTVRDATDGFRIATLAPPPGAGELLAARYEAGTDSYDRYIGQASLAAAVDPAGCAEAYAALASDAALRRKMGEAARRRAREEFDWRVIVRRYQALWGALAGRRAAAAPLPGANPRRADPFLLFAGYPSRTLAGSDRVATAPGAGAARLRSLRALGIYGYGGAVLPGPELCARVLERAAGGCTVEELLAELGGGDPARLERGIVWLCKLGLLRVTP